MTTLQERVAAHFAESIRAKQEAEKVLVEPTVQAAELMLQCLMNDGKILACGNGGSAADAQHFAAEMAIPPTSSKPSKRHTNAICTSSP